MTFADLEAKPDLLLLNCRSGSHAYGLATETSDEDFRGVFLLPKDMFYGMQHINQLADATNDRSYYELGRFFELLAKANPTALELLATVGTNRLYCHPLLSEISVDHFLSKACKDTFTGYAKAQIRKAKGLNKKVYNPIGKTLKTVLDFCYVFVEGCAVSAVKWLGEKGIDAENIGLAKVDHARDVYVMYYDPEKSWARGIMRSERANEVALSNVPKGQKILGYLSFNKDAYSTYCRDYREYWEWVEKRNEIRYQNTLEQGGGYDAKNMMHTIRLLEMGIEIMRDGQLNVVRPNREFLLEVKAGKFDLDEILAIAEDRVAALEVAAEASDLPDKISMTSVEAMLVKLRKELYQ